jgi:hypothetical protein
VAFSPPSASVALVHSPDTWAACGQHSQTPWQQIHCNVWQTSLPNTLISGPPLPSPPPPNTHRVLQIGDASGIQSPLSFGGFGALTRHMGRLRSALTDALAADALSAAELGLVNGYNPGLSAAWMLQRAMTGSRGPEELGPSPDLINRWA